MLNRNDIGLIVHQIEYKDWKFVIGAENSFAEQDLYLQIQFYAQDNSEHCKCIPELQKCRKWRLSPYMTETEIVRTAWKAVLAAEEHEAGENFKYCSQTPFNPHISIDGLMEASSLPLDKREENGNVESSQKN